MRSATAVGGGSDGSPSPNVVLLLSLVLPVLLASLTGTHAFAPPASRAPRAAAPARSPSLRMALDPVTYLRTEWVSAALVTNQTPRSADKVLELGCEDGRIVNFVPRTVREIVTSSAEDPNSSEGGGLTVACTRQLKQQAERRGAGAVITYSDQRADDLSDTPSSSIDIVVSLQTAERMAENGLDWKKGIVEAGRVLKPGGRLLFVESSEVGNENYLDFIMSMSEFSMENKSADKEDGEGSQATRTMTNNGQERTKPPIFQEVGYDQVDMVLQPHIAGVAIKAMDADLSVAEIAEKKSQEESDRMAEISLNAFERGSKRRRRKKKKKKSKAGVDGDE